MNKYIVEFEAERIPKFCLECFLYNKNMDICNMQGAKVKASYSNCPMALLAIQEIKGIPSDMTKVVESKILYEPLKDKVLIKVRLDNSDTVYVRMEDIKEYTKLFSVSFKDGNMLDSLNGQFIKVVRDNGFVDELKSVCKDCTCKVLDAKLL